MKWYYFRSRHGAPSDTKLTIIARNSGQPRVYVTAVWWELLDYASQNTPRGSIKGFDPEIIAMQQEIECHAVSHIVTHMQKRGMIDDNLCIVSWAKNNPKREDYTAAERKRLERDKKRIKLINEECQSDKQISSDEMSRSVTHCHAVSHIVTESHSIGEEIYKDLSSDKSNIYAEKKSKKKLQVKTLIDRDMELPPDWREYALTNKHQPLHPGFVDYQWTEFKGYYLKHGKKMVDWEQAWQSWVRSPHIPEKHKLINTLSGNNHEQSYGISSHNRPSGRQNFLAAAHQLMAESQADG